MIQKFKKQIITSILMGCIALSGIGFLGPIFGTIGSMTQSGLNTIHSIELTERNVMGMYDHLEQTGNYARSLADAVEKTMKAKKEVQHAQIIHVKAAAGKHSVKNSEGVSHLTEMLGNNNLPWRSNRVA